MWSWDWWVFGRRAQVAGTDFFDKLDSAAIFEGMLFAHRCGYGPASENAEKWIILALHEGFLRHAEPARVRAESRAEADQPPVAVFIGLLIAQGFGQCEEHGWAAHVAEVFEHLSAGRLREFRQRDFEGIQYVPSPGMRDDAADGACARLLPCVCEKSGDRSRCELRHCGGEEVPQFSIALLEAQEVAFRPYRSYGRLQPIRLSP